MTSQIARDPKQDRLRPLPKKAKSKVAARTSRKTPSVAQAQKKTDGGAYALEPETGMSGAARAGILASLGLFILVIAWLNLTMISGAVIATGQAVVRGKPKVIQSLDGGVVSEIFVHDGDVVSAGDVLLRFDPTLLTINLNIYRNRLVEVVAREARLEAEYLGKSEVMPPRLPDGLDPDALSRHFIGQTEIFSARREVLEGKKEQLEERVRQFHNQITGVEGRIAAINEQLGYLAHELESVVALQRQGLARESQALELQRNQSALFGQLAEAEADLARIRNSIRDTELEILQAERQFKEDVVVELREVTSSHEELVLQIVTIEKQLERIEVRAPVDGVVHEMQVATIGGVVAPEGTILEVVPTSEGVEFELRVDPKSVDQVFVGQRARVVFPGFDLRALPEIFGSLAVVSPTSIMDRNTGQSYFRVTLTVPAAQLALLGDIELLPGMPVEAFLQTGERSVMSYLTKPLTDQLRRAFRDG